MDAVTEERGLHFAGLNLDGLGPAGKSVCVRAAYCVRGSLIGTAYCVRGSGPRRDNVLHVKSNLDQLIEQGEADAFFPVKFLAKLLVGSLGIGGEAIEAGLHCVARLRQGLLEHLMLAI